MMDSEYLRLSKRISKTKEISASYVADTIIPVGSMLMWTSSALPSGWLLCDGTAVSRETYSGLFNAIGTTYGAGDNSTTFNLPNLKGKFPIGLNAQDTECDTLGETGGAKTYTLTEAELPSHDHSIAHDHASATTGTQSASHTHYHNHGSISSGSASTTTGYSAAGVTDDGTNQNSVVDYLTSSSHTHSVDIPGIDSGSQSADHTHAVDLPNFTGDSGSADSGSAHNNMPPFLTVSFIISYKDVKIPFKGSPGERGNTGNTGAAGENAPQVQCQFSSNGISWHAEFASGDAYIRFSTDDASTWGATILFKGEKGDTGDSGPTGATGAQGSTGVSIRSKGAWSNATEYVNNAVYIDIVNHNGSSYICKLTGTNFEPPNATYWNLAASKGEIGATGATGNTGATGAAAPNVLTEYSSNNASWHSTYAAGDGYIRFSYDGGSTYGTGMLFKGLDGEGTGDVIAPAANTDGNFPQWDGSNTKTLKDGYTLSQLMLAMYPVGAIFTSVVSTSPATLFGGTWSAFGAGRVLVSYQSGDSDFGTVEGTTGSKTHTLAQTEIPAHTHTQNSHTHSINHDHASATSDSNGAHSHKLVWDSTGTPKYVSLSGSDAGGTYQSSGYRTGYSSGSVYDESTIAESVSAHTHAVDLPSYSGTSGSTTATSQNTGSGNAHNNLQPSITVYMWKRTA